MELVLLITCGLLAFICALLAMFLLIALADVRMYRREIARWRKQGWRR